MAKATAISWAHSTFNPWIGCTKVSPGCDHCYAEAQDKRWGNARWGAGAPRTRTRPAYWREPLKWNAEAKKSGQPWRVFCASLADVFDNEVPDEWRRDLWQLIADTPNLTWMLLTKRIGNVRAMLPKDGLPNAWLGATIVNQDEADRDIPKLLEVPARVRWLSMEPLLGPVNLTALGVKRPGQWGWNVLSPGSSDRVEWVVVGGESGPQARPMAAEWARQLLFQCRENHVAYHFKQWGGLRPVDGGHLLDGVEIREFPR